MHNYKQLSLTVKRLTEKMHVSYKFLSIPDSRGRKTDQVI